MEAVDDYVLALKGLKSQWSAIRKEAVELRLRYACQLHRRVRLQRCIAGDGALGNCS